MPNWADVCYKCVGDPNEVRSLYNAIKKNGKRKNPRVKNGFGTLWLGCIIDQLGGNWEKYPCRGEITDYSLDDGILTINQNCAWCEQEGFRHFIEQTFPSIKVYYQEQESGCEVFLTNSFEYFPEHYFLDSYEDWEFFENLEDVAIHVSKIIGHKVETDFDKIQQALDEFVEEHEDEDLFYSLHEFQLTDN